MMLKPVHVIKKKINVSKTDLRRLASWLSALFWILFPGPIRGYLLRTGAFPYIPFSSVTQSCPTLCDPADCNSQSCPQSFRASRYFPMSRFFPVHGQSTGTSISASVLWMNIQGWLPLGLSGLISLLSKRFSRVFSNTIVRKHQFFSAQPSIKY